MAEPWKKVSEIMMVSHSFSLLQTRKREPRKEKSGEKKRKKKEKKRTQCDSKTFFPCSILHCTVQS
ncbi:hypothetical protein I7I53_04038 [Histoplasma capsulatum var. duboisii H88]|uniref:Uncharacterized protein n=1 Tax=Ajellomyces capsulatus (strain H88) TaxID=544711 RepID=A0A8A1LPR5_AJEC8|nr:hypothetical protein I7I53_04038 [Histoplasma capsulatum var. duboisii H88]